MRYRMIRTSRSKQIEHSKQDHRQKKETKGMAEDEYFDDEDNPFLSDDDGGNDIRAGDDEYEGYDDYDEDDVDGYAEDKTKGSTYGGWLISIIIALIPIVGIVYLIIKGLVNGDSGQKSTWARAMLSTELAVYMAALVVLAVNPDILSFRSSNTQARATISSSDKSTDNSNENNGTSAQADDNSESTSKTVSVAFRNGALIELEMPDAYAAGNTTKDGTTEACTFTSSEGNRLLTAVCLHDSKNMKDFVTEDYIKSSQVKGVEVSDLSTAKNKYFTICSYTKVQNGITTYECLCYGEKGDYITISAYEKIKLLSASYT